MSEIKSIKKKAVSGDQIIVVNPIYTECNKGYKIGDIFTVKDIYTASIYTTTGLGLWDEEYEVII